MVRALRGASKKVSVNAILFLVNSLVQNESMRKHILRNIEQRMYFDLIKGNSYGRPAKVQEEKFWTPGTGPVYLASRETG